MSYNSDIHHRRSIRLKGYNYSRIGLYFVTLCVQNRQCLFGDITHGEMVLNDLGRIIYDEWMETAKIREYVKLHEFVVMPNHFHGIVEIAGALGNGALHATPLREHVGMSNICVMDDDNVGALRATPLCARPNSYMSSISPKCGELSTIVRAFKSATTRRVNQIGHLPNKKLWQRNYYEHIIRNEQSYQHIAGYIVNNSMNWENDRFYVK